MNFVKEPLMASYRPSLKIIALVIIIFVSMLFTSIFGLAFAIPFWGLDVLELSGSNDYSNPEVLSFLKYYQIINQLGMFVIPALLMSYLISRKISSYLKLNVMPELRAMFISAIIILLALPFIGWLGEINRHLALPEFLSSVEEWMQKTELKAAELIAAFLNVQGVGGMLFNLFLIAIIPAVAEEFLFRGVVLRLFKEWIGGIHGAVIVSAILFSALHLQFYGFLPRLVLGLLLGYAFVFTGSLWVPMLMHFVNNGFAIVYIYATGSVEDLSKEIEVVGTYDSAFVIIGSAAFVIFFMLIMYKWYLDNKPIYIEEE